MISTYPLYDRISFANLKNLRHIRYFACVLLQLNINYIILNLLDFIYASCCVTSVIGLFNTRDV